MLGVGRGPRGLRPRPGQWWALLAVLLLSWTQRALGACTPVAAEFVLTGLSNPDGNRANHEIGICLPQFTVNLTTDCGLTLTAKHAAAASISLLVAGRRADGSTPVPLANDAPTRIADAVHREVGYYYLEPRRCPQTFITRVKGAKLLAEDIAALLRRQLDVPDSVLLSVAFTAGGLDIVWMTAGPKAQQLSYTAISKVGGPVEPDFTPFQGTPSSHCSLLDINPAMDLDSNPADGVADASTSTLVSRVPRPIPGRRGHYVCAITPAGGYVRAARLKGALGSGGGVAPAYSVEAPLRYATCGPGGYLYRLGAINLGPDDPASDNCMRCPRGSYSGGGASLCLACDVNQYQDQTGQRACKPCQYGYASHSGAARCMGCYYGRPYCSEGYTPDELAFTCNNNRLPEGYSPEAGYAVVQPRGDPVNTSAARHYAPMFRRCSIRGAGGGDAGALLAFNVSAECRVAVYPLGDLGAGREGCSQYPEAVALTAAYVAPNMLATMGSPGLRGLRVGVAGVLESGVLKTRIFATAEGKPVPEELAEATEVSLQLTQTGWGYLGGGDNGRGQNANMQRVNADPCPPGTTKELLNGDGTEKPGEDVNVLLSHYCVPCGPGTFCPGRGTAQRSRPQGSDGLPGDVAAAAVDEGGPAVSPQQEGPQNCPAGTYGTVVGASVQKACLDCPAGTYQDTDGSVGCRQCPPNTFAPSPGATQCSSCSVGYEIGPAGSNTCSPCQPGTYRDSTTSDVCIECPVGTSSGEAAARCSPCGPGTYASSPRSPTCTECPRGSFQRSHGQRHCQLCPVGTYGDSRGRSACSVCPVGTFNPSCGSESASACQRCPPGHAAPRPGSGACSACGAGYFADRPGMASCRACPSGTFASAPGASQCTPCPKGTFADRPGAKTCRACPIGTFAANGGAARCMACPAGAFTTQAGASSCSRCPPGTYSRAAAPDEPSAAACAPCPPGTYSFEEGSTGCRDCRPGQYAPRAGSTGCAACPLGTYVPEPGAARCLTCRAGFTTAVPGGTAAGDCRVRVVLNRDAW